MAVRGALGLTGLLWWSGCVLVVEPIGAGPGETDAGLVDAQTSDAQTSDAGASTAASDADAGTDVAADADAAADAGDDAAADAGTDAGHDAAADAGHDAAADAAPDSGPREGPTPVIEEVGCAGDFDLDVVFPADDRDHTCTIVIQDESGERIDWDVTRLAGLGSSGVDYTSDTLGVGEVTLTLTVSAPRPTVGRWRIRADNSVGPIVERELVISFE